MKTYEKGISLSIWTLSWPIFIEVFLQLLVGNIDQVMMSHYSPQAVAAVANAYLKPLQRLSNNAWSGFTTSSVNGRGCAPPLAAAKDFSKEGLDVFW